MRKYLLGIVVFILAFGILTFSFLESASVEYAFTQPTPQANAVVKATPVPEIDYELAHPGAVLPDSLLWNIKALRDKIWYILATSPARKSELALLFADKRLLMTKMLFEKEKPDLAFSTLSKGEKYLETAMENEEQEREAGGDTTALLKTLALASLKHRQVVKEILEIAPEDSKPGIIKIEEYSKKAFVKASQELNSKGIASPKSPFEGD